MGGHAFKELHCPRIPQDIYDKAKIETTDALLRVFSHVVVPTEMPCKPDHGDIDFLVSGPLHFPNSTTIDKFDWEGIVRAIGAVFYTNHGRRGFLTPDCMYFAIVAPGLQNNYHVQVDVKVCFKPELFEWCTFELNYASNSKMIGSMVKPLGFTIDPEGVHIRVEEIEETNFPGSMVWISKSPKDFLRIVGLDHRIINAGFKTNDEIYEYFASSCLFNPAHFSARLAEEKYSGRIEERSPHWIYFLRKWLPKQYPGYVFASETTKPADLQDVNKQKNDLQSWYKQSRAALREKVFTMFPHVATEYYRKRAAHIEELEEQELREKITEAIPVGLNGWKDDFPMPNIIIRQDNGTASQFTPFQMGELTPPLTPTTSPDQYFDKTLSEFLSLPDSALPTQPWTIPLYLDPLPRSPPLTCSPRPPPANMSPKAKLICVARWTLFDSSTGAPCLLSAPRDKDFEMHWNRAVYAGATAEILVNWAKDMWWYVWIRQAHINYVGMWKKRFEKEDKKAEKARVEAEATAEVERLAKANFEKLLRRLKMLNTDLGFLESDAVAAEGAAELGIVDGGI